MEKVKENRFIIKFFTIYIVNVLSLFVQYSVKNIEINASMCSAFFLYCVPLVSASIAGIWQQLENHSESNTLAYKIRNLVIAVLYVGICLEYIMFSKGYSSEYFDTIVFYLVAFVEIILITLFEPLFAKLFRKEKFVQFLIDAVNTIFWTITYWLIVVIALSWTPIDTTSGAMKLFVTPAIIISKPIEMFVGYSLSMVATIGVGYMLKAFFENELQKTLKFINQEKQIEKIIKE